MTCTTKGKQLGGAAQHTNSGMHESNCSGSSFARLSKGCCDETLLPLIPISSPVPIEPHDGGHKVHPKDRLKCQAGHHEEYGQQEQRHVARFLAPALVRRDPESECQAMGLHKQSKSKQSKGNG